jgi:hypothetical protein
MFLPSLKTDLKHYQNIAKEKLALVNCNLEYIEITTLCFPNITI